ncbi:hypothetical protein IJG78_03585 [Candidatus Saccharibacteria bacterium]|nr:hypothetical protein [Candidatus Saccharibacteria bacterium]
MIIQNGTALKQIDYTDEKELQTFFEKNLETILGYKFIETEFTVGNFRIDTLAFDENDKSFKIIEFKNVRNASLVDQGYTYLKLMLERKADFVLRYNRNTGANMQPDQISWENSRIIFVSPTYTPYQQNAADFKDIPVDLIKVRRYENNIVDIDFINKESRISFSSVKKTDTQRTVDREVRVYTEEDHISRMTPKFQKLYEILRDRILETDDNLELSAYKIYIGFKIDNHSICAIEPFASKFRFFVNILNGELSPEEASPHYLVNLHDKGHHAFGDYAIDIMSEDHIDYIIPYLKKAIALRTEKD